jgi:hypothetical protein
MTVPVIEATWKYTLDVQEKSQIYSSLRLLWSSSGYILNRQSHSLATADAKCCHTSLALTLE